MQKTANFFIDSDSQRNEIPSERADESRSKDNNNATFGTPASKRLEMKVKIWFSVVKARFKELILLFVISITVLAAIKNDQLLVRPTPPPVKLFTIQSPVVDFENGSFSDLLQRVFQSDVSFIMYYAPWDAECIRFKREYELIASHHQNQIFFAAINCWWPDGECRQRNPLQRYPSLVAYVQNAGELTYNGPLVASYIIPFLDNLVNPVQSLQDEGQLFDLIAHHDGVVVGYFDFNESPQPSGYNQFFKASVKSLYNDPWRRVKFAVISSRKVANKLRIEKPSSITLYFWNSKSETKSHFKNFDALIKWVYDSLFGGGKSGLVEWMTPSGRKSDALASKLSLNNTLILFTPRSLILGASPYYEILREVAMDYFDCNGSSVIRSLIMRSILNRRATEETLMEMEEKCHEIMNPAASSFRLDDIIADDSCCHSQIIKWYPMGKRVAKKCYCTACLRLDLSKCPSNCKKFNCLATAGRYLNSFEPLEVNRSASFCNELKSSYVPKYSPYYKVNVICSGNIPSSTNSPKLLFQENTASEDYFFSHVEKTQEQVPQPFDEKIYNMVKGFSDRYCSRLALGLKYSDFNFPDSGEGSSLSDQKWRESFTGLGCRANKTLKFLAIDSILFPSFAESLGVDVLNETHATIAFIMEPHHESVYMLDHRAASTCCSSLTLNKRAIYETIKNFTNNQLQRHLRSSQNGPSTSSSIQCLNKTRPNIICVPEISSSTFKDIVLTNRKDVVLFYYTPWCGYCSSIAHVYLTIAKYFQDIPGIIFARINGDSDDLPFEYSAEKYPTIALFGAERKYDMVTFPSSDAITESNLVKFILNNAHFSVRLKMLFSLCDKQCLLKEFFAYENRSKTLYRSYHNDLIRLTFMKSQLGKKKKNFRMYLIQDLVEQIVSKRRAMKKLPLIRQILRERLEKYEHISSPSSILEDEKWLNSIKESFLHLSSSISVSSKNEEPSFKKSTAKKRKTKDEL